MNQTPKGTVPEEMARLLKDKNALQALLKSQDAQRLIQLLSQQNGAAFQSAAQEAAGGKPQALSEMLGKLSGSQEGAALVERLQGQLRN